MPSSIQARLVEAARLLRARAGDLEKAVPRCWEIDVPLPIDGLVGQQAGRARWRSFRKHDADPFHAWLMRSQSELRAFSSQLRRTWKIAREVRVASSIGEVFHGLLRTLRNEVWLRSFGQDDYAQPHGGHPDDVDATGQPNYYERFYFHVSYSYLELTNQLCETAVQTLATTTAPASSRRDRKDPITQRWLDEFGRLRNQGVKEKEAERLVREMQREAKVYLSKPGSLGRQYRGREQKRREQKRPAA